MANYTIGDLIRFNYPAVYKQGTRAHDAHPTILVLHQNWQGLVHGINFNYLSNDNINMIRMILDPSFQLKHYAALEKQNAAAARIFDNVMRTAGTTPMTSPSAFYRNVIAPLINNLTESPYRLYKPEKMSSVRIMTPARVMMGESYMRTPVREETPKDIETTSQHIPQKRDDVLPRPTIFEKFRNKFQHARGPKVDLRLPVFERFRGKNRKK